MSRPISVRALHKDVLSAGSSRSSSRARTPMPDGEENGSLDVNFSSLEELLSQKLESLQQLLYLAEGEEVENRDSMVANSQDFRQKNADAINKARIQSSATSINDIIISLLHSRAEVSSLSREMLLAQLYKIIVTKPIAVLNEENARTKDYVGEESVLSLVKLLTTGDYRSPSEFILLFRSVISLLTSDLEDYGELVSTDFLAYLESLILEPPNANVSNENKAGVITGFCSLLLILYADTSAFGVDDKVKWLLEYSQGFVQSSVNLQKQLDTGDREYSTLMDEKDDKSLVIEQQTNLHAEANIAIAGLHGVAVLLTLLQKGEYLNELLNFVATEVVEVIDNDVNLDLAKAGAKVLALCYEMYTYEEDKESEEDDDEFNYNAPYYEQESIISICNRLASTTAKKIGKKDKKETNSVFREVVNAIENYTNAEKREEIYKRSPVGLELLAASLSSTHVKLSRSKSLSINSWFLYFRLLHLKWCFGFGLHDQLVGNDTIRPILREPLTKYQDKYNYESDGGGNGGGFGRNARTDVERFAKTEKKRDTDLKKARVNKITQTIEHLDLQK